MAKKKLKKSIKKKLMIFVFVIMGFIALALGAEVIEYQVLKNIKRTPTESETKEYYTARDFGFVDFNSLTDYNFNGINDTTDILNGAKKFAENNPKYVSKYYENGYPPDSEGVSTDVIWYSLKEAGFLLKDMINYDIISFKDANYKVDIPDDNIDFRRVGNIELFLQRYGEKITNNINYFYEFMPGDIIIFDDGEHVAMVSDKRNKNGIPYIIHNRGGNQTEKEEDLLQTTEMIVTGHYRLYYNEKLKDFLKKMTLS